MAIIVCFCILFCARDQQVARFACPLFLGSTFFHGGGLSDLLLSAFQVSCDGAYYPLAVPGIAGHEVWIHGICVMT